MGKEPIGQAKFGLFLPATDSGCNPRVNPFHSKPLRQWAILALLVAATAFAQIASGQSSITVNVPGTVSTFFIAAPPIPDGKSALTYPIGIIYSVAVAPAAEGGFYIVSPDHHRVYRVSAAGAMTLFAGSTQGFAGDDGPATSAKLNDPRAVAVDSRGRVYISDFGNNCIRKVENGHITTVAGVTARGLAIDSDGVIYAASTGHIVYRITPDGNIAGFAGNGFQGFSGDGGPAVSAQLNSPQAVALDPAGSLYIADSLNNRIRRVTRDGTITTIAGNGIGGFNGDGGRATLAQLNHPMGVAVDKRGALFIADYLNNRIRTLTADGTIVTVAGTAQGGTGAFSGAFAGDGGSATNAALKNPISVAVDDNGNLYIADSNNKRIRKVTAQGTISTVAGDGNVGGFGEFSPRSMVVDALGNLYVSGTGRIVEKFSPDGTRSVFAGSVDRYGFGGDGGPASLATFAGPTGLAIDRSGNIFIADSGNHRIRKVSPEGIVTTVAGSGGHGYSGDGGQALSATMSFPTTVAVDEFGSIYIGDQTYRIRKVSPDGIIRTVAGNGSWAGSGTSNAVGGIDGNALTQPMMGATAITPEASGTILISDGPRLRRLFPDGTIRTIAGTPVSGYNGDGPATSRQFFTTGAHAIAANGDIYFTDINNHLVRKLTTDGNIVTVAGTGKPGYTDGPPQFAQFYGPTGLVLRSGVLFVTDDLNAAIRKLSLQPSTTFLVSDRLSITSKTAGTSLRTYTGYGTLVPAARYSPAAMAIIGYRENGVLVSETTVDAARASRYGRIFAQIDGTVNTGLAIANPNAVAAPISFTFLGKDQSIRQGSFSIPANGQISAFLNEAPFNGPNLFEGSFTFAATVPVAATALRGFTNERGRFLITTLPVVDFDASGPAGTLWIAQYASGGGWQTQVYLVNPTDTTIQGTLQTKNADLPYSLPPRGAQALTIPDAAAPQVSVGAIRLVPDSASLAAKSPSAIAVFSYRRDGITVSATGVQATQAARVFRMYAQRDQSIQTGVAIANTSDVEVTVRTVIGPGTFLPTNVGEITIPPRGQTSLFLDQIPGLERQPASLQGVVRFEASAPIAIVGLRGHYNERGDFLMAAMSAVQEGSVSEPRYFPHFADGGGYQTEIILFGIDPASSAAGEILFTSPVGGRIQPFPQP